jgi:hypothetical protein
MSGSAAQLLGQGQAVAARHVEVEDRQIDRLVLEQRDGLVGVAGLQPRPLRLQGRDRLAQNDASQLAVVDDENRRPHETTSPTLPPREGAAKTIVSG